MAAIGALVGASRMIGGTEGGNQPNAPADRYTQFKMASAIFSAAISVGKFVLAHGTSGKIEASTTRKASTPRTRPWLSVTAIGSPSAPMRQLQEACQVPIAA